MKVLSPTSHAGRLTELLVHADPRVVDQAVALADALDPADLAVFYYDLYRRLPYEVRSAALVRLCQQVDAHERDLPPVDEIIGTAEARLRFRMKLSMLFGAPLTVYVSHPLSCEVSLAGESRWGFTVRTIAERIRDAIRPPKAATVEVRQR